MEERGRLKPCPFCNPVPKKDRLQEINTLYAPGGDHDPNMTKARESCPRTGKEK